jgi:hypothetical protein
VDRAGNVRSAQAEFTVLGIPAPTVTYYQKEKRPSEYTVVKGTAVPNGSVTLFVEDPQGRVTTSSAPVSGEGTFTLVSVHPLRLGVHGFWIVAEWGGTKSAPTDRYTVTVRLLNWWHWLILILVALVIIILLLLVILLSRKLRQCRENRGGTKPKTPGAEKGFDDLCRIIREEINGLERTSQYRYLTSEERKLMERLRDTLCAYGQGDERNSP